MNFNTKIIILAGIIITSLFPILMHEDLILSLTFTNLVLMWWGWVIYQIKNKEKLDEMRYL